MTDSVRKEIENRLETTYHIRVPFENLNENHRVSVIASLLHAYDTSWQVDTYPSLIGSNHFSNISEDPNTPASNPSKKDVLQLKRWLGQMGVGYLVPKGTSIADSKKFTHLCSTLMDKIEQRHGAKLKPLIRQIVGKQSRLSIKSMKVNNTNNELDSSANSTTSTATIELENPFATNRTLVRSSTKENNSSNRELNVTFEKPKTPEKAKTQNVDEKENQPLSRSEIPRTPQTEDFHSQKEVVTISQNAESAFKKPNDVPIPQGKTIPRTPTVSSEVPIHDEKKTEELKMDTVDEDPMERLIPSGKSIPRTPVKGHAEINTPIDDHIKQNESEQVSVNIDQAPNHPSEPVAIPSSNQETSTRSIPSGNSIPRTPNLAHEIDNASKADEVELNDNDEIRENVNQIQPPEPNRNIPTGNSIPRTPVIEVDNAQKADQIEQFDNDDKIIVKVDRISIQSSETIEKPIESIPSGRSIPRTPLIANETVNVTNKVNEASNEPPKDNQILNVDEIVIKDPEPMTMPANYEKPKENFIPSGKHVLPRTPHIENGRKEVFEKDTDEVHDKVEQNVQVLDDDSREIIKERVVPKSPSVIEERSKIIAKQQKLLEISPKPIIAQKDTIAHKIDEKLKANEIPKGKTIPRTPAMSPSRNRENKAEDNVHLEQLPRQVTEDVFIKPLEKPVEVCKERVAAKSGENFIPRGKNVLPRTPLLKESPTKTLEVPNIEPLKKSREKPLKPLKQPVVEPVVEPVAVQTSNKPKRTRRSKKTTPARNQGETTTNVEKIDDDKNETKKIRTKTATIIKDSNEKEITSKSRTKAEKKKDTELLASPSKKVKEDRSSSKEYHKEPHVDKQTESDFSKQTRKRRSPRFDNQDTKMLKDMDKSIPKDKLQTLQIPPKQRLERVQRNKSILAEVEEATTYEAVKLPQIEIKKRRGRPRKNQNVAEEVQEIQSVTIEEFIPSLKMAQTKNGSIPNKRVLDEIFSTPLVQRTKSTDTKKPTRTRRRKAPMYSIEDEIYQTPDGRIKI